MQKIQIIGALVLANAFFGAGIPMMKTVLYHVDPLGWIFLRTVIVAAILFIWQYRQIQWPPARAVVWLLLGSFLGVVINQIAFAHGLSRTISSHAGIINATVPLFTLFFGWIFLQEKMGTYKLLGVLLGFGGVLYLMRIDRIGSYNPFFLGDIYIWVNVIGYSLFLMVSRHYITKLMSPTMAFAWMALMGAISIGWYADWLLPVEKVMNSPSNIKLYMAYLVIFPGLIAYVLNLWSLKRVESSEAAIYVYIQPIVATVVAYFMMGDIPDERFWVSALLIALGIALSSMRR